jgi:hypothetical protein
VNWMPWSDLEYTGRWQESNLKSRRSITALLLRSASAF